MKRYLYVWFNDETRVITNVANYNRLKIDEKHLLETLSYMGWDWVSESCYIYDTSHYEDTNGGVEDGPKMIFDKGLKYLEKKKKLKKYIKKLV